MNLTVVKLINQETRSLVYWHRAIQYSTGSRTSNSSVSWLQVTRKRLVSMELNVKLSTPKGQLIVIWLRETTALAMCSRLLSQRYPWTSIIHKLHNYPKVSDLFLGKRCPLFTSHVHSLLSPTAKTTTKFADAFCSKCCQAGQGLGWDHWTRTGHWKQVWPAGYTIHRVIESFKLWKDL